MFVGAVIYFRCSSHWREILVELKTQIENKSHALSGRHIPMISLLTELWVYLAYVYNDVSPTSLELIHDAAPSSTLRLSMGLKQPFTHSLALSSKERENRLPSFWNIKWPDLPDRHP